MRVELMAPDRPDRDGTAPPANAGALGEDLELDTLLDAMAGGDAYLREQAERALLCSLTDPEAILYRQDVFRDCLERPDAVRELYALAVEALESKRKVRHFWFRDSPDQLLHKSLRILELLTESLRLLRRLAERERPHVASAGFTRFFERVERDLDELYLGSVDRQLRRLAFRRGTLISAELGRGNRGVHYVLRKPNDPRLRDRLAPGGPRSHSFTVPARDEHGLQALAVLRDRGIDHVADALAQSTDHILGFFESLRAELGFYVACLNLYESLVEKGEPTCFPVPRASGTPVLSACGLYDVSLAFHLGSRVVGNDVAADDRRLVVVTGANQGGKSTFLRSLGLAQLMMQAGMFVAAESFHADVVPAVHTHFKRGEDAGMTSGKLDEELGRMSGIADLITPSCLLLCNESFASTNEREGSEIARQVIGAMIDAGVKVVFVTHLFDLAAGLHRQRLETGLFLRADRDGDGHRSFSLSEGEPLPTSYGEDSYRRIFAAPEETDGRAGQSSQPEPGDRRVT